MTRPAALVASLLAVFHARELVELGGLISYGSSLTDQFRRVGVYVNRILKGDKPGEPAVRQPGLLSTGLQIRKQFL